MRVLATHYTEAREAFGSAVPYLVASLAVSSFLFFLAVGGSSIAVLPPAIRRLSRRRHELLLASIAIPLCTLLAILVVFWAL
jgi:hypothetical protein